MDTDRLENLVNRWRACAEYDAGGAWRSAADELEAIIKAEPTQKIIDLEGKGLSLRELYEIATVHDLLVEIEQGHLNRITFVPDDANARRSWSIAQGALCWALQHGCERGKQFAANLARLEQSIKDAGYNVVPADRPIEKWIESAANLDGIDPKKEP